MHHFEAGRLQIARDDRVFVDGREVRLGPQEQRLLLHIVGRRGQLCLLQDLVGRAGDGRAARTCAAVGGRIRRLRRKLGRAARMLETVRGLGYRLADGD
jgi:DNA-binding response OmpR family regulator